MQNEARLNGTNTKSHRDIFTEINWTLMAQMFSVFKPQVCSTNLYINNDSAV